MQLGKGPTRATGHPCPDCDLETLYHKTGWHFFAGTRGKTATVFRHHKTNEFARKRGAETHAVLRTRRRDVARNRSREIRDVAAVARTCPV